VGRGGSRVQKDLGANPNLPGIHYRLGRLPLSAPKTATTRQDAQQEFEAELKIDPRNAGAEHVLEEMARQAQRWDEAVKHFTRATEIDPTFADSFLGLGVSLLAAERPADAIQPLEVAAKLQPENPAPRFQLALAYRPAGR
jgi:tetratricopeptide (TPR) repeat protein